MTDGIIVFNFIQFMMLIVGIVVITGISIIGIELLFKGDDLSKENKKLLLSKLSEESLTPELKEALLNAGFKEFELNGKFRVEIPVLDGMIAETPEKIGYFIKDKLKESKIKNKFDPIQINNELKELPYSKRKDVCEIRKRCSREGLKLSHAEAYFIWTKVSELNKEDWKETNGTDIYQLILSYFIIGWL